MDLIQFIVILIGLAGLYWYQHYRIKQLEGKTKDQSELLQDIKTYFDIINPDLIKYRVELLEQTLEKEKKIEIEQIRAELDRTIEGQRGEIDFDPKYVQGLVRIMVTGLFFTPHGIRKKLVATSESEDIRQTVEKYFPTFQEVDKKVDREMLSLLLLQYFEKKAKPTPRNKA